MSDDKRKPYAIEHCFIATVDVDGNFIDVQEVPEKQTFVYKPKKTYSKIYNYLMNVLFMRRN